MAIKFWLRKNVICFSSEVYLLCWNDIHIFVKDFILIWEWNFHFQTRYGFWECLSPANILLHAYAIVLIILKRIWQMCKDLTLYKWKISIIPFWGRLILRMPYHLDSLNRDNYKITVSLTNIFLKNYLRKLKPVYVTLWAWLWLCYGYNTRSAFVKHKYCAKLNV